MSHKRLREEKNCLNCGATVEERFCSQCGQENLEIQDSTYHLIIHFIHDIFHYDGRFWHTLKKLFLRPGLVALEYMQGKRARYLKPVQFYVFASSVFFLLLFYTISPEKWSVATEPKNNYAKRLYHLEREKEFRKGTEDTTYLNKLTQSLKATKDSLEKLNGNPVTGDLKLDLSTSIEQDSSDDSWFDKMIRERTEKRTKELEEKHEGDEVSAATDFMVKLFHKLPQLLFLSMPFFALFLKLLYIRSAKRNYVEHLIFSIYHYAYLFVIMSFMLVLQYGLEKSGNESLGSFSDSVFGGLTVYMFIYLMLSMKRFYNDRWRYLIPRYLLLMFLFIILLIVLLLLLIFIAYIF